MTRSRGVQDLLSHFSRSDSNNTVVSLVKIAGRTIIADNTAPVGESNKCNFAFSLILSRFCLFYDSTKIFIYSKVSKTIQ